MELWLKTLTFIFCGISLVASFSWKNCGDPADSVKIISLDVYSNHTKILYVTGRGKLATNITAPVKGQVIMMKKFFWGWTKVPCVDNVGSCIYDNICDMNPFLDKECPPEFIANDLPCKCPVPQGQYSVKKLPVDLSNLPYWIEEGKYRIQLIVTQEETELLCLLLYITL